MELEDYLIEERYSILAINRISQIISQYIGNNYYNLSKDLSCVEEILALNRTIQMIAYCMRIRRKYYYKQMDITYTDDFTYDSVIYEEL